MKLNVVKGYSPKATETLKKRVELSNGKVKMEDINFTALQAADGESPILADLQAAVELAVDQLIEAGKAKGYTFHIQSVKKDAISRLFGVGFQTAEYIGTLGLPEIPGEEKAESTAEVESL